MSISFFRLEPFISHDMYYEREANEDLERSELGFSCFDIIKDFIEPMSIVRNLSY